MELIYKNLKATLEKVTVTEKEIDEQLLKLQQQNPKIVSVTDRAAQNGDEVVLDYAGFCGGEQFEGGTAEKQALTLGSGMFIPGFEEQLIGARIGEEVVVSVTFPTEYHAPQLAGKKAEFRCTIHEIHEKSPYALDDVFAKEVGQCESYAQLREQVGKAMQDYYDERSYMELQDRLIRQAAATLDFAPTQKELDDALEAQMQTMAAQLGQRGLSLEMYCQFSGTTMEQLREDTRGEAENALRIQKTCEAIAALENLRAEERELEAEYDVICRQNGMTREQLTQYLNDDFNEAVRRNLRMKKALRFVCDHAEITEREAPEKKR